MNDLLDAFDLGDDYEVVQEDTMTLRHLGCGETVSADVLDVHERRCDA